MSRRPVQDLRLLLAALAGLALLVCVTSVRAGRQVRSVVAVLVAVLPVAGLVGVLCVVVACACRVVATRRGLLSRARLVVLAPDSFDPGLDAVLRCAAQLRRARRSIGGWFDRRAGAVRVLLDLDPDGRARYSLQVPARAVPVVHAALGNYHRVQTRQLDPQPESPARPPGAGRESESISVVEAGGESALERDERIAREALAQLAEARPFELMIEPGWSAPPADRVDVEESFQVDAVLAGEAGGSRAAVVSAGSMPAAGPSLTPAPAADPAGEPGAGEQGGGCVVRAELRLARGSSEPLARLALDPDPLQPFMAVIASAERRRGERVEVAFDLLPVSRGGARRLRRRLLRRAAAQHSTLQPAPTPAGGGDVGGLVGLFGPGRSGGRQSPGEVVALRAEREQLAGKLLQSEPLFELQVLVRCEARTRELALHRLKALLACFEALADANSYRTVGIRMFGLAFLGADLPGSRGWFDRRMSSGLFHPSRRGIVSAREMAWLLKPPSVNCRVSNVLRLGAAVNPPPRDLPTIVEGKASGLLPLGRVEDQTGDRVVGVQLKDTFFTYITGRSRWGKTELAICQFLHLVRSGHGGLFLDPHEDAITRIKSCLTEETYTSRILELDVVGGRSFDAQPGWNLFAARGLTPQQAEGRVQAIVDSFASALQWGERNNRALMLTTQAAGALIELSQKLPDGCQPTIFQIPTLLGNPDWLATVLPHLSVPRQQFFKERFPRLADEAITPVTNLIDRLRSSTQLAALLGAQTSSYDIAAAMNEKRIVLACPGAGGATDRLVANLLVFDLLHAAKRRAHTPAHLRAEFHVFLDEVQTYDGAASGNLAALLEQTAKYGIRATLLNQNPERLTSDTLQALTTNRSHLIATALNSKAAALIAREWGGDPDGTAITNLPRYKFIAQATLDGQLTTPFVFHGIALEDRFPGIAHPDRLDAVQPAIDTASGRQPTAQTITELDTLDERIAAHLAGGGADGERTGGGDGRRSDLTPMPVRPGAVQ